MLSYCNQKMLFCTRVRCFHRQLYYVMFAFSSHLLHLHLYDSMSVNDFVSSYFTSDELAVVQNVSVLSPDVRLAPRPGKECDWMK